ncbi:outer membrane protein assembly factor BamB [Krasilnikovia cinnamomea]|uniref:Outer membrane protein assembly factor BamB n=1 Tax=Krasilnikovia cinnamomea TaxID=349313 RepID=A0A4Q7ZSN2_9ACTN|nr:PQQ-binding-like beta-propeller repeat protein [Krasilnikovia cinnamomea]RZU53515.1 outer membrane protein assembly factor BamB [Krasilnikovia cinnamomea]
MGGWSCSGTTPPLVATGRVFVADETGVGAYQAKTGRRIWHHRWDSPDQASTPSMALSGGLLLVGVADCESVSSVGGDVFAFNVATGRLKWHQSLPRPAHSLLVDKGVVVTSGASDTLGVTAYRVRDGRELWTLQGYFAGAAAHGRLFVSGAYDVFRVAAVSITTGRTIWTTPDLSSSVVGGVVAATPAGDLVYTAYESGLLCLRSSNGSIVWRDPNPNGQLATDGRRVYRASGNAIEALSARTGRRLWTTGLAGSTSQPVRAGGLLYTVVSGGKPLGILNAANGSIASTARHLPNLNDAHVVVSGGRLYMTIGNTLVAYAL